MAKGVPRKVVSNSSSAGQEPDEAIGAGCKRRRDAVVAESDNSDDEARPDEESAISSPPSRRPRDGQRQRDRQPRMETTAAGAHAAPKLVDAMPVAYAMPVADTTPVADAMPVADTTPVDVANAVIYAVSQPINVNIAEIVVRPPRAMNVAH